MRYALAGFWREQAGQDIVEYSLLLAFVAIVSVAMFVDMSGSISAIWSKTDNNLQTATSVVH